MRNREQQRKAILKAYTTWPKELTLVPRDEWGTDIAPPVGLTRVFRNNRLCALVYDWDEDRDPLVYGERATKVMVRNLNNTEVPWRDLQYCKNIIFGPNAIGKQYLPPEKDLVDQANMYWFFVKV